MDDAVQHLVAKYSPKGSRIGWLMMASILVEAWDLYSIAFVLIFINQQFHPGPLLLGLGGGGHAGRRRGRRATRRLAGRQDRPARDVPLDHDHVHRLRPAQAFVPNVVWLVIVRLILDMPLGSDISNGYTYITELMRKGDREVMGNRWQFMFAVGQVLTLAVVTIFIVSQMPHELIWRVTLGLGAVPAFIILVMRHDLPETAVWLIRRGRFRAAKRVARDLFGDLLDMLPNAGHCRAAPASHRVSCRYP